MKIENVVRTLLANKIPVFSFEELCAFYPEEKTGTLKKYIFRWKKMGWLIGLRKGLYELTFPYDFNLSDMYVANKMYSPSYVSLETALSNYGIIPEVAIAVVSVTTKSTRRFKNKHGLFLYRTIQSKAFCGYRIEKHNGYNVFIAEPEKAIVDYIYFNTFRGNKFDAKEHRIDIKQIKKMDAKKIKTYAGLYGINIKETLYAYL